MRQAERIIRDLDESGTTNPSSSSVSGQHKRVRFSDQDSWLELDAEMQIGGQEAPVTRKRSAETDAERLAENVSHVSVGFYYHIAARVILDWILLSGLYVLSQFHDHVVFGWTWIHTVELILFIHFRRNFDFRVLHILRWKCCVFLQVLRLSARQNTLNLFDS